MIDSTQITVSYEMAQRLKFMGWSKTTVFKYNNRKKAVLTGHYKLNRSGTAGELYAPTFAELWGKLSDSNYGEYALVVNEGKRFVRFCIDCVTLQAIEIKENARLADVGAKMWIIAKNKGCTR